MKRLPVDVSSFKRMITDDYLYIDKTEHIYNLITRRRLYFLARPRRFGKSLLISTLQELFEGNKELFKNTWIGTKSNYDWQQHHVLRFDFSAFNTTLYKNFEEYLMNDLEDIADVHGIDLSHKSPGARLRYLIQQLSRTKPVVILIDEYDAPILSNLHHEERAQEILRDIKSFFSMLKSLDAFDYIKALFITGVTRLARTSTFSGLNNLTDITLSPEAALLLGYSQEELTTNFKNYFSLMAKKENISLHELSQQIQQWYNGYRFSQENVKVYNPYSIVHCCDQQKITNFWLESGTPSFLIPLLKKNLEELGAIEGASLYYDALSRTFELDDIPIIPALVQTGYLTIENYDHQNQRFTLNYPNREVSESFRKYILSAFANMNLYKIEAFLDQFKQALAQKDVELFCICLTNLFAHIPYHIYGKNEAYYHSILHVLFALIGPQPHSEEAVRTGRIDLATETHDSIWIFEFKFNSTGALALNQILEKQYYEKYLSIKKPIMLVGLAFNLQENKLTFDWADKKL